MSYSFLKLIHILSATLMIGTGFGSAFYLFFTYRSGDIRTLRQVLKLVILADTFFTAPSVIIQLLTGLLLSYSLSLTYTRWFWIVLSSSIIIFVLWIRAAYLQIRLSKKLDQCDELTPEFHRDMRWWVILGVPSFALSIFIYYMMVYKAFL